MDIRVDERALEKQLQKAGYEERHHLLYHQMLLNGELPYAVGGGIDRSCLCMLLLDRAHIGEVRVSIRSREIREECRKNHIFLL